MDNGMEPLHNVVAYSNPSPVSVTIIILKLHAQPTSHNLFYNYFLAYQEKIQAI